MQTRLLRSSALRLSPVIALLFVPFFALIFYQHHVDAANTVFTVPTEARGDTFAGVSCAAGCTGTAISIPSGRMGLVWVAWGSGEIPVITSNHSSKASNEWTLITSSSFGEPTGGRRGALFATVSDTNAASAITIQVTGGNTTGGTMVYSIAASGYTSVRQARIVGYKDPVSEGGSNGSTATSGQSNFRRAPVGPIIAFLGINGTATGITPEAGFSELNFGSGPGEPEGNNNADPTGSWSMADDVGDATPSASWTGSLHWYIAAVEVSNAPATVAQVELRGVHELAGAAPVTGSAVSTRAMRIFADSAVVAGVVVNDGIAGNGTDLVAPAISDTTAKTWIAIGTIGSTIGDSQMRLWRTCFSVDESTTITFTPGDAITARYAFSVVSFLGADCTAPIAGGGVANGTATVSVDVGSVSVGNLPFGFFGADVVASIAQGTGDQEQGEAGSTGTTPQRIQIEMCGSNICDVAGIGGNQGTGVAFQVALNSVTAPEQGPTPTPTPPPAAAPASDSSSNTNTVRALIALSVMIVPLLLVARFHLTLAIILATSLLVLISIVAISTL